MSEIRNCSRADLAAVAGLFQKTFRDRGRPAPPSLAGYLDGGFLDHPGYDPEIASRVHVDKAGRVTGFIGVFPGRFEHRGRQFRAAIAGTLMVESPEREPLAGAKLLRSVVKGPQDISISETTNLMSQRLWEPLGGKVVPLLSLDWFRIFRPSCRGGRDAGGEVSRAGGLLAPAARAARLDRRFLDAAHTSAGRGIRALVGQSRTLGCRRSPLRSSNWRAAIELRPAWEAGQVEWLLSQAARKERYGALHRAIVSAPQGRTRSAATSTMADPEAWGGCCSCSPGPRASATSSTVSSTRPIRRGLRAFAAAARTDHERAADTKVHLPASRFDGHPHGRHGTVPKRSSGRRPHHRSRGRKLDPSDRRRIRLNRTDFANHLLTDCFVLSAPPV